MKKISHNTITSEKMTYAFNNAIKSIDPHDIKNSYIYAIKEWFNVFVQYSNLNENHQKLRANSLSSSGYNAHYIDIGINQIINQFNKGNNRAIVEMLLFDKYTPLRIYDTDKGYLTDSIPVLDYPSEYESTPNKAGSAN